MDKKPRILVVEDNDIAQKMAVMTIEMAMNAEIHVATTGKEAITKCKQHQYDLIFMDLGLPDIDGYTVTETIRALEEKTNTHTPIVALTAHANDEDKQKAADAKMDDFLSKPLTTDSVKGIFEKYVR